MDCSAPEMTAVSKPNKKPPRETVSDQNKTFLVFIQFRFVRSRQLKTRSPADRSSKYEKKNRNGVKQGRKIQKRPKQLNA